METRFQCKAKVFKCVAGDDINVLLYVGIAGIQIQRRVRLDGVSIPKPDVNLNPDPADEAKRYVESKLLHSQEIVVELVEELTNQYIRGRVYYLDVRGNMVSLNDELANMGYSFVK